MSYGFFCGLAGLILGFGLSELIGQIPFKTPSLPGLKLGKYSDAEVESRAMEKLKMLGFNALAKKQASQISGG